MDLIRISIALASVTIIMNSPLQACFPDPCHPLCGPAAWRAEEITCDLGARRTVPLRRTDGGAILRMIDGKELSLEHLEGAHLPRLHDKDYGYHAMLELVINPEGRVEAIFVRNDLDNVPYDPSEEDIRGWELASIVDARLVEIHKAWVFDPESLIGDSTCVRYGLDYLFYGSGPDGNVEGWTTLRNAIGRLEKRQGE